MSGTKHDTGKNQVELISPIWIWGVGKVLTFGAQKYAAHNWRKGLQISRLLGAALRHIFQFLSGEDNDQETGLCHLYHASCELMFACEMLATRPDLDDRYKVESIWPYERRTRRRKRRLESSVARNPQAAEAKAAVAAQTEQDT